MAKREYSHAHTADQVIKASQSQHTTRAILLELLRRADFTKPETTVSKQQLMATVRCTRRTVQIALQSLRSEGVIVPIRHFEGGRGLATTYEFRWPGQGGSAGQTAKGAGDRREAIARILAENPRLTYGEAVGMYEKTEK